MNMTKENKNLSLIILPDSQFHSRYATKETGNPYQTRYGSDPYNSQIDWILKNKEKYNINMALHLGDIVDESHKEQQWEFASHAMKRLEDNNFPYAIIAGNHDARRNGELYYGYYLSHFSAERATSNGTLIERDPDLGIHEYHIFEHSGISFLVLALSWAADEKALNWAEDILRKHPDKPTIIISHQLINVNLVEKKAIDTEFGKLVFDRLISPFNQVFMTFNGHHHGAVITEKTNHFGNPIYQVLMDHQMAYMGGNGYFGLLEIDWFNNRIQQTTFSPWILEKDADLLVSDDQAIIETPGASWAINFDFSKRFPQLGLNGVSGENLSSKLIRSLKNNFNAPKPRVYKKARNLTDYPKNSTTVAHWRPPLNKPNTPVAIGELLKDVVSNNHFKRADLNLGSLSESELNDIQWSSEHHPLSSWPASIHFQNGYERNEIKRGSYFVTEHDAPINFETFETGYTIEVFIKFDKNFKVAENSWSHWLAREGKRGNLKKSSSPEPQEPPLAMSMSTLKEVQFQSVDTQSTPTEISVWSGEIVDLDRWYHLAVVNNSQTGITDLFIDGVPMLRNAMNTRGLAHDAGKPWNLGAGVYDEIREAGFNGWIGEVRITAEALSESRWLTAR